MQTQAVIQYSLTRLSCTACGAEANASCSCGKPYVPAKQRAREAIEANPQKSDRAIAADIGVDHKTVGAARRETGECSPVDEPRVGLDGKVRRLPVRQAPDADDKVGQQNLRNLLLMNAAAAIDVAVYHGPVDREVVDACRRTAEAWNNLAESLEGIMK